MTTVLWSRQRLLAVLLGALLLVAQSLAVAHAYQHDLGSPVDATCGSCVLAGQLSSGCADSANDREPEIALERHEVRTRALFRAVTLAAARQRGPPE